MFITPTMHKNAAALEQLMEQRPRLTYRLNPSERRVCKYRAAGWDQKSIAHTLGISPHTVHDHIRAIHRKLKVCNMSELTLAFTIPPQDAGATTNV